MDAGRRKFVIIAGSVLLLALVVIVVARQMHGQPRIVRELTVGNAPFAISLPESGVIQYPQIQTMSTQISGNIGRIFVKTGDRVIAGQLLATIQNPQIVSDAQSSAAAYRAATARAESTQVTDTTNVAQAQANLEAARARLAQARQDLASGSGRGLGSSAGPAPSQANANYVSAATALREAQRTYVAYRNLYANKAISRDQLDQAEAKYEQAQAAYNQLVRSRTVLQDDVRSAQEGYVQAQTALAAARVESGSGDVAAASAEAARAGSEYAFAQEQADATQIHAPYDGIVLSVATEKNDPVRPLQPGDAVAQGQPLIALAQRRAFVVRTKVDEQDVINVHLGERVQITGEDFPGRTLSGHVVEVSPIAQRSEDTTSGSRTVATTISVDNSPTFLRDGMSVNVNILTTDLQRAIVVPNDAIGRDGGTSYVFVVRNDAAYRRRVSVGLSNEASSVIVSGLSPGDVIVAQSVVGLTDGAPVSAPEAGHS
ncbi:MAG TPA: efflux RND transporter periplasmic adaptor subunit [Candidatus Cybelea sp.]|nr:efflux RND transporter periplasmic adaptor subunit [Candidatus Cybelea sp.]